MMRIKGDSEKSNNRVRAPYCKNVGVSKNGVRFTCARFGRIRGRG